MIPPPGYGLVFSGPILPGDIGFHPGKGVWVDLPAGLKWPAESYRAVARPEGAAAVVVLPVRGRVRGGLRCWKEDREARPCYVFRMTWKTWKRLRRREGGRCRPERALVKMLSAIVSGLDAQGKEAA